MCESHRAFAWGEDVNLATAGEIFAVPPSEVGPDQRRGKKATSRPVSADAALIRLSMVAV